jgi:DNA-binding response OmpR family regulator
MSYVLVIEDDASICETMKFILEHYKVKGFIVKNLEEVNNCLKLNGVPNITLLDCIDGYKSIIKILDPNKIIIMTAWHHAESIQKEHNLNGYLKKPFSLEELENILQNNISYVE